MPLSGEKAPFDAENNAQWAVKFISKKDHQGHNQQSQTQLNKIKNELIFNYVTDIP